MILPSGTDRGTSKIWIFRRARLTVKGVSPTQTLIDAQNKSRAFWIIEPAFTASFSNLTIKNGNPGTSAFAQPGGLFMVNDLAAASATNVIFTNDSTAVTRNVSSGGAI